MLLDSLKMGDNFCLKKLIDFVQRSEKIYETPSTEKKLQMCGAFPKTLKRLDVNILPFTSLEILLFDSNYQPILSFVSQRIFILIFMHKVQLVPHGSMI